MSVTVPVSPAVRSTAEPPPIPAPLPAPTRTPTVQALWLVVYWTAVGINGILLAIALLNASEFSLPNLASVSFAWIATLIGALFATRILRRGVQTTVFIRGTTTVRVIAIAWIIIEIGVLSISVISTVTGMETAALDWTPGFAGAVGSISILAVLGPGYSEYREAVHPRTA